MNFSQAVSTCLKKYVTFEGRASRSEYWYFFLFCLLLSFAASIFDIHILGITDPDAFQPVNTAVALATLLPGLTVAVRRLHDVNRSGWWLLIGLTIVGLIFPLLVWYVTKGNQGPNRFGEDPLSKPSFA